MAHTSLRLLDPARQGTTLLLGPLNYLFVHTFNSGKYCLGVFDNRAAGTLLGGITFRNVLVRYDRANRRVGFGPGAAAAGGGEGFHTAGGGRSPEGGLLMQM